MDKKKILFIIGIILIVIMGIVAINIGNKKNINNNIDDLTEKAFDSVTIENLKVTSQSLTINNGICTYMANITNNTKSSRHIDMLFAIFELDGEEINALALSDIDIESGKTIPIKIEFDRDISTASKVSFKIK